MTAPTGAAAPSRAWASLPPIQRTTGDMPLVAAPRSFAGELPGTNALPPIVRPLGHEVSALATPGLVVARTRATPAAAAPSLPAPVQRRAARAGSRSSTAAPVAAPAPAPEVVEHHAHEAPSPAPVVAPVRSMPTISRSAVRVPDRPLTSAAAAARPAALQRSAAPTSAASAASGASPVTPLPSVTGGGMRRSKAPIAGPTVSRQAVSPAPQPPVPALPSLPSGPTRAGLGEPMTSLPASARPVTAPGPVIARQAASRPMPLSASSLRRPVQRSASEDDELSISAASPAAAPVVAQRSAGPGPSLPHLPVVGSARRTSSAGDPGTQPAAASAAGGAPEIRPIAAANPIRTSLDLQRDAADDVDDGPDDALPSPWWESAGGSTPAGLPTLAGSTGASAAVQRSPAAGFSAAAAPSGSRSVSPPTATTGSARVQRAATGSRSTLPALTMPPAVVARASAQGGGAADGAPAAHSRTVVAGPVVQMIPAAPTPPSAAPFHGLGSPGATVQRDGTVAIAQQPGGDAAGGAGVGPAGPAGASGPAGPAASGGRSERDLDELAQALFGRIRTRLRSDLIHDREAKGLTFDNV